jgi:hypothetical protein
LLTTDRLAYDAAVAYYEELKRQIAEHESRDGGAPVDRGKLIPLKSKYPAFEKPSAAAYASPRVLEVDQTSKRTSQSPNTRIRQRSTKPSWRWGDADEFEAQHRMRYTSDMQRWEYMTFDLLERELTVEELNRLGREGWEAVATVGSWGVERHSQHPVLLFKRPLPNAAEGSSGV